MKISFKGDYALKIMLDLSLSYDKGLRQIKEIAKRQDIPEKFLEQIVTLLKSGNYIKTVRGPNGGISLAKKPSEITIGEIVRLVDGSTAPIACVSCSAYTRCTFEDQCVFKDIWAEVRTRTNELVDTITFEDMVKKHQALRGEVVSDYSI